MMRDFVLDLSSLLSRTVLCYVCSLFLQLGRPMDGKTLVWTTALIVCVSILFYVFRRMISNPLLFSAVHITTAVLAFFLIPAGFAFGFSAGLLFLLADSFYCRLKKSRPGEYTVHWSLAVFLCVLYIVGAAYGMKQFNTVCFYGTACYMACYFLQTGLLHTNAFLDDNRGLSNVPVKKIRSQAAAVLFVFSAVVFAVMAVAPKTVLMSAAIAVQNGVLFVVRTLLGFVHVEKPAEIVPAERIDLGSVFSNGIFETDGDISPIWDILDNIVFILVYAAIIIGVVALIMFVYNRIKRLFSAENAADNDLTERIVPDRVERMKFRSIRPSRKLDGPAENVKIRKLYKKYAHAAAQETLSPAVTPGEIAHAAREKSVLSAADDTNNAAEIRRLYEKARYSGQVCSNEDIEQLKKLVKGK